MAAIVCTRTADELEALYAGGPEGVCQELDLCFFDQGTLLRKAWQLLSTGYLMDCNQLRLVSPCSTQARLHGMPPTTCMECKLAWNATGSLHPGHPPSFV